MAVKEGHRQRQAQATREQVAAAARRLFAERGYIATTIAAIAEAADIPAPTIYSAFGTKKKILDEVLELWIRGTGVRRDHEEALLHPDPEQRLRRLRGGTRGSSRRALTSSRPTSWPPGPIRR